MCDDAAPRPRRVILDGERDGVLVNAHAQTLRQIEDGLQLFNQVAHAVELFDLFAVRPEFRVDVVCALRGGGDGGLKLRHALLREGALTPTPTNTREQTIREPFFVDNIVVCYRMMPFDDDDGGKGERRGYSGRECAQNNARHGKKGNKKKILLEDL